MRALVLLFLFIFFIDRGQCLWTKGIVHYAINNKDYDLHSQDIITTVLDNIQKEICVKFFKTPMNYSTGNNAVLYISNPDKLKNCPSQRYDFKGSVVDMPIGYKCLNERDITRLIVNMLRASIKPAGTSESYDLGKPFVKEVTNQSTNLLQAMDRSYINKYYHKECSNLVEVKMPNLRTKTDRQLELTRDNEEFYKSKLWPLGIVWYGVEETLHPWLPNVEAIQNAMAIIESSSCVVFQQMNIYDALLPKHYLWLTSSGGESIPRLGFTEGNQTLLLSAMVQGASGHASHALNQLLRVLGVPMMSNRYDRDTYLTINWNNVQKGMEYLLERLPVEASLKNSDGHDLPYDFTSATHAPVNYLCRDCALGEQTVSPIRDTLWQKTLSMGHRTDLSEYDIEALNSLYNKQCRNRHTEQE